MDLTRRTTGSTGKQVQGRPKDGGTEDRRGGRGGELAFVGAKSHADASSGVRWVDQVGEDSVENRRRRGLAR